MLWVFFKVPLRSFALLILNPYHPPHPTTNSLWLWQAISTTLNKTTALKQWCAGPLITSSSHLTSKPCQCFTQNALIFSKVISKVFIPFPGWYRRTFYHSCNSQLWSPLFLALVWPQLFHFECCFSETSCGIPWSSVEYVSTSFVSTLMPSTHTKEALTACFIQI